MTERPAQGRLIVFEGLDGVGKSTLAQHLTSRLREVGIPCRFLAFPGRESGTLGRLVYDLHHDAPRLGVSDVNSTSLQVLHIAAHIDAIEGEILPALLAALGSYSTGSGGPHGPMARPLVCPRARWRR